MYTYYNLCQVCLDCNIYFLLEKQVFNGLLKLIGIQNQLIIGFYLTIFSLTSYFSLHHTFMGYQVIDRYIIIIIIRSRHVYCTWPRRQSLFFLRFGHGPILVQINLQHSQAQPYGICTRVIYLTQTHYMCNITQRSSQYPFLSLWYDSASGGLDPQTSRTLKGRSTTALKIYFCIQSVKIYSIDFLIPRSFKFI